MAWQKAFTEAETKIDGWKIHRRIEMSGRLFTRAVARELGPPMTPQEAGVLQRRHGELFRDFLLERRPLPVAVHLLKYLRSSGVAHGIASGS